MGNDGGSIPKRRELVKEAARLPSASELKATALETLTHQWSTCPISSEPLDPYNTVSDWRGRLYNYETVLRCLIPSAAANEDDDNRNKSNGVDEGDERQSQEATEFKRTGIRSLKDVVKLRFNIRKDESSSREKNNSSKEKEKEIRTCPLSMKELGASTRAVYIVPCGHVFAEIAMRELQAAEGNNNTTTTTTATANTHADAKHQQRSCSECSEPFLDRDIVPVVPIEESDIEKCTARIEELRALGLAHNLKKDKNISGSGDKNSKKKKRKAAAAAAGDGEETRKDGDNNESSQKKQKKDRDNISSRINNSMTASLTAKVLAEQDERNKQRKLAAAAVR